MSRYIRINIHMGLTKRIRVKIYGVINVVYIEGVMSVKEYLHTRQPPKGLKSSGC